ncbi:peptide/nickel transport system ATP-binding protein/oligopeptide transport system ATP-binding protein [Palleronia aestuarii]|uniref:Peptide/nickel transport system ATP-binding protein/oligopeptide transport system ATP-binding protein n=1 Tax=Palleronia aestuarii TaxID=568105 RepID=A0A2W7N9R1_9RHOB|nr:oligopeptide/dipeptide ABC transporter ATP-binding protein [Palleronia aestuarii]PZX16971.1 peptide/nickel transport system ATP-binding protein/oligopeptide transport system ATP-binding protein [Palleronia aestuarii]
MSVLIEVEGLGKTFHDTSARLGPRRPPVRAVDGVSFQVMRGEVLAVVGESGCGKSTLGRLLLHLIEPSEGRVVIDGQDMSTMGAAARRQMRRQVQMVFQDPFGSLSPRRSIADIVAEPLDAFGLSGSRRARRETVADLLRMVGLPAAYMDRKPRQFSGGQRQRIGIARAISVDPSFIVADEPVSALDVSIQAQIINLMQDLQREKGFAYLFIAHDLAVVRHIADRVAVMYLGRIVEIGGKDQVYGAPHHPYTEALLSAAPEARPGRRSGRIVLQGDVPSPSRVPSGCAFRTRCPLATELCARETPPLVEVEPGRLAACHFASAFPITRRRNAA